MNWDTRVFIMKMFFTRKGVFSLVCISMILASGHFLVVASSQQADCHCGLNTSSSLTTDVSSRMNRCFCIQCALPNGTFAVSCQNITDSFPVLTNTTVRDNTKYLTIERSSVQLGDLGQLYPTLEHLSFRSSNITFEQSERPFISLSSLRSLRLYWTTISSSHQLSSLLTALPNHPIDLSIKGMFQGPDEANLFQDDEFLQQLKNSNILSLEFTSNDITIESVQSIMCNISNQTKKVVLGKTFTSSPVNLTEDYFTCLRERRQLEYLGIKSLRMHLPQNTTGLFRHLSYIKIIDFYHTSSAHSLDPFSDMPRLTNLSLGENAFREFEHFTGGKSLDQIKSLNLTKNSFPRLFRFLNGSFLNLSVLDLSENHGAIQNIPRGFIENTKIEVLRLDSNHFIYIDEKAFRSAHLRKLSLNSIKVDLTWISSRLFLYANESLEEIHLNYLNRRKPVKPKDILKVNQYFQLAFRHLGRLKHLSLVAAGLSYMAREMFTGTHNLEELDLQDNLIESIDADIFRYFESLSDLNLNYNSLTSVNKSLVPAKNAVCLHLHVSFNPFMCNCNITTLKKMMESKCYVNGDSYLSSTTNESNREAGIQLDEDKENYLCKNIFGLQVSNFDVTYCSYNALPETYFTVFVMCICLILIALTSSTIFRFRYHIYYIYIHYKAKRRAYTELEEVGNYEFDAFVSYNSKDSAWVVKQLRPKLENYYDFKLCLHERDWLAGRDIVDNIVESIDRSRKTILIISNAYACSTWCQLELTMAQHQLLNEDRNNVVLILKEPLLDELVTPRLALQMKQSTYIKYDISSEMSRKVFWEKVARAIRSPSGSVRNAIPFNT